MTDQELDRPTLPSLVVKTVVVHTVTYFIAGVLAYTLNDYKTAYAKPPLSYVMRPTTDTLVIAGPLFQPIRGVIFALAFHPLRAILFGQRRGWLVLWWLLLALGVLSTFGPAFGSVEGLIYRRSHRAARSSVSGRSCCSRSCSRSSCTTGCAARGDAGSTGRSVQHSASSSCWRCWGW
jgi:hypothetical protein